MYRVIIVEDEPEIARTTKGYVEKHSDFQVKAIFANGQEALNYIWLNPVDLILLDLFMPQVNGKEFLYRLRKENLPVEAIVMTAANDTENVREVLPFGVVDYLLKPFTAERLAEALERFIQRHQILSAKSSLDQRRIDAVFSTPAAAGATLRSARLEEQGLVPQTYEKLLALLTDAGERPLPAETLAEGAGLSKVAVRRYLNRMIEAQEAVSCVEVTPDRGPVMMYRRRGGTAP